MLETLKSWSWQDIQAVYEVLGHQLRDYKDTADRFELKLPMRLKPGAVLPLDGDPQRAEFVGRWYLGVNRLNMQIDALDYEISRRNKLIGVMG